MRTINEFNANIASTLSAANLIFWDFDGVIKDSIEVKTLAYENLFRTFGSGLASRVRKHHESYGGVSRYDKIPLYLNWAGEPATPEQVQVFCAKFATAVQQAVVESPWVPGVRDYLLEHCDQQYFVLVTATPQIEIEQIITQLELTHCFREVHGAPNKKAQIISTVLSRLNLATDKVFMIGDSETDFNAAQVNSVPFILRRTAHNLQLQTTYGGISFVDLNK